jgi:hypothetical protein
VTAFIPPSAAKTWTDFAASLVDDASTNPLWPGLDLGNVLAAKQLYEAAPTIETRKLVAVTIHALATKAHSIGELYAAAGELREPVEASAEDKAFHSTPLSSGSFYYLNEGAMPLYQLQSYDLQEADSPVECSKKVCCQWRGGIS